jgi:hypothetical protein
MKMNLRREAPTITTLIGFAITIGSGIWGMALTWGHNNAQLESLAKRADIQAAQVQIHTSQLTALDVKAAVTDTKLDAIKETVDRIENKLDADGR